MFCLLESLSVSDVVDFLSVFKILLLYLLVGVLEFNNDSDSDSSDEEDFVVNIACRYIFLRFMIINMKRLIIL